MAGPSVSTDFGEAQMWRPKAPLRIAKLADIEDYIHSLPPEHAQSLIALYLDPRHNLVATQILARRRWAEEPIKPMRVISQARQLGAFGFIIAHYDPARVSGPTVEEKRLARELRRVGEDCDLYLLHYLIVGRGELKEAAG